MGSERALYYRETLSFPRLNRVIFAVYLVATVTLTGYMARFLFSDPMEPALWLLALVFGGLSYFLWFLVFRFTPRFLITDTGIAFNSRFRPQTMRLCRFENVESIFSVGDNYYHVLLKRERLFDGYGFYAHLLDEEGVNLLTVKSRKYGFDFQALADSD